MIKESSYTSPASGDDISLDSVSSEDVSQAPKGYCCAKSANPAYGMGRRLHLLQMLILPFIPILALIIQTAFTLKHIMLYRQEVMDVESQVRNTLQTAPSHVRFLLIPVEEIFHAGLRLPGVRASFLRFYFVSSIMVL